MAGELPTAQTPIWQGGRGTMKGKKLLWSICCTLVFLAVLGVWERPISGLYFKGIVPLRLALAGAESRSVTVAGLRVHYDVLGPASGPPVILVHGLGGRAEEWLDLAHYLVKAGYRVYLPDLPGYGRSQKPTSFSYSVPDEAAIVVGFLDAVDLKQVDLGGISMGGWIVQLIASEHPERVRRLMLFDSAGIHEQPSWDTRLFTPSTPAEVSQLNALLYPHPFPVPGFVARDIVRLTDQNGWVIRRAVASMLAGRDVSDDLLPQLKMPVLIVWGAEDRIMPLHQGEKMHSLVPQSQLEIFPDCGHLSPMQCASQVGPKVVEFVKQ
jgi:pimeloyl-ACP methyl ester carboxylesterase